MTIRQLTKQETQQIYKAIEEAAAKILQTEKDEYKHIKGIIIIGIRDNGSYSRSLFGQVKLKEMLEAFAKTLASHYEEKKAETQKHAT